MIKFGFQNKLGTMTKAIGSLIIGILMVLNPENSIELVVKVLACFMMASGIMNAIVGYRNRENGAMNLMVTNALVNIIFGALIFSSAAFVGKFVLFLIGFVLLIFGLFQIVALWSAVKYLGTGIFAFLLPALSAVGGAILLFNPFSQNVMGVIAGVTLIIYGASVISSYMKMRKAMEAESIDEQ